VHRLRAGALRTGFTYCSEFSLDAEISYQRGGDILRFGTVFAGLDLRLEALNSFCPSRFFHFAQALTEAGS
jgi:hypothetical protein